MWTKLTGEAVTRASLGPEKRYKVWVDVENGHRVYQLTEGDQRPETSGGYRDLDALLRVKGAVLI